MATWQFSTHLNRNETVTSPSEVAKQLPPDSEVRVVLMTGDSEEPDWDRLTAEQFLEGYAPGDEIYDALPPG
jgi:hypothetical protein